MTSHYNTQSWRDDYELDGVHPAIAHAIHQMHTTHAADVANRRAAQAAQTWPFPAHTIPTDGTSPPRPREGA